jgi:hypothetical protein
MVNEDDAAPSFAMSAVSLQTVPRDRSVSLLLSSVPTAEAVLESQQLPKETLEVLLKSTKKDLAFLTKLRDNG